MPRNSTPVERLIVLFGSMGKLSREIGVVKSTITQWRKRSSATRKAGEIPSIHNTAITEAAGRLGFDDGQLAAVHACLSEHSCPLCDQPLPDGFAVSAKRMKELAR